VSRECEEGVVYIGGDVCAWACGQRKDVGACISMAFRVCELSSLNLLLGVTVVFLMAKMLRVISNILLKYYASDIFRTQYVSI
jgi:hypothetical protein